MPFDPTEQLTESKVKEMVRDILDHGGELTLSYHARERMEERNYGYRDIRYIIGHGQMTDSVFNERANNWKYTFKGKDLDGDSGKVVLAIITAKNCIIITVI